jgi:hypothetical protein
MTVSGNLSENIYTLLFFLFIHFYELLFYIYKITYYNIIMAFTRFHDDPIRIKKELQESTFAESYYLNKPGNGTTVPFQLDPQLRLQGWGANLCTNAINLESDFRGLTRKLNRDLEKVNDYFDHMTESDPYVYDNAKPFIDESRATHPAWMYRVVENAPSDFDMGVKVDYLNKLWFVVNKRVHQFVSLQTGVKIKQKYSVCYAYDYYKNPIGGNGAHEIGLQYDIN